jgi:bacterioferritin-associated ferredoxin
MFACICRAVTRDEISAAIDEGADTIEAVSEATRAGTGCGTCRTRIGNMISERAQCPLEALRVV